MILNEILIEGFLGIGLASMNLRRKGTTLIEGTNLDVDSALSNGAGKSSLFESVFYALYGQTRRGLRGDDIINTHCKSGTLVAIELVQKETTYVIVRSRKSKVHATGLRLFSGCSLAMVDLTKKLNGDMPFKDLTRGTVKETQELIDELIGISAMTFAQAVYFGQGDVRPFAALTDSDLKQVFEQALGLTAFSDAASKVKGYLTAIEAERSAADATKGGTELRIESIRSQVELVDESIKGAEERSVTWKNDVQLIKDKSTGERDRANVELGIVDTDIAGLSETLEPLTAKLDKLNELAKPLRDKQLETKALLGTQQNRQGSVQDAISDLQKELRKTDTMIGTACKTCGRPFSKDDIAEVESRLAAVIADDMRTLSAENHKLSAVLASSDKFNSLHDKLTAQIDSLRTSHMELRTKLNSLTARKAALNEAIVRADVALAECETKLSSGSEVATKELEGLKSKRLDLDMEIKTLTVAMNDAEAVRKAADRKAFIAMKLVAILGNSGVKSYVFDAVTPALNEYINQSMMVLDETMNVEVSTVSKLKSSDELREKFAVNVTSRSGAPVFAGHSGGEKQKVNLAIALGFNRLVREMNGSDLNLLVLDEPFEALDDVSSERAVDLLGTIKADNMYLITHNPAVKDLLANRMTITKKGGVATLA